MKHKETRSLAAKHRESVDRELVLTDKMYKTIAQWLRKHTSFQKQDLENVVGYCIEFAWTDWDPLFNVPFEKFLWTKKSSVYLYLQKGIERQLAEHAMGKKRWYEEVSVAWLDDDGQEHAIEKSVVPNYMEDEPIYCDLISAEEFVQQLITEINTYTEHLLATCDYSKLSVLYVLCTSRMHLTDVANKMGLSHRNLTPVVQKVCCDLGKRIGLSGKRVKNALAIIKAEVSLNSQLIHHVKEIIP